MPPFFYKKFAVTGSANVQVLDTAGVESTSDEKKTLHAVLLRVTGYAGNDIVVWREREKLAEVPDYLFDTEADLGAANFPYSTTKMQRLELELPIPVGETVKIGIVCGGTNKDISGAYVYSIGR